MKAFQFSRADSAAGAVRSVAANPRAMFLGGGTNLVDLMKLGVERPDELVDITRLPFDRVHLDADGTVRIGANVRNSDLAAHPAVRNGLPLLSQALLAGASGQLRNMATLGGNLLQRNRCWYYRNPHFSCFQTGGDGCPARDGLNLYSAVIDQGPCVAPHASSLAMALLAYDARVEVHGRGTVAVHELYGDGSDPTRDHLLDAGEVLLAVELPAPVPGERAAYHRAISRAEAEWPLVEAVARLVVDGSTITLAAVAVGGVAHTPLRLPEVEAALVGQPTAPGQLPAQLLAAAQTATQRCEPLAQTGYKVDLLRDTVLEVVERAAAPPP